MNNISRRLFALIFFIQLRPPLFGFVDLAFAAKPNDGNFCKSSTFSLSTFTDSSTGQIALNLTIDLATKKYGGANDNKVLTLSFAAHKQQIDLPLHRLDISSWSLINYKIILSDSKNKLFLKNLLFADTDFTLTDGSKFLCKMRVEAPDSLNAIVQRMIISDKLKGIFTISGATPACPPTAVSGWSGDSRVAIFTVEIGFDADGSCTYSQDPSEPLLLRRIGDAPERIPRSHSHPAKETIKSLKMIHLKKGAKPFEVRLDEIR
jgi:hypothetical protein